MSGISEFMKKDISFKRKPSAKTASQGAAGQGTEDRRHRDCGAEAQPLAQAQAVAAQAGAED